MNDLNASTAAVAFLAQVENRALLYAAGKLPLHDAVDELQAVAERDGIVAAIGQDAVQAILAEVFGAVR